MPIPAGPQSPANGAWKRNPLLPVPEDWQHTYASITGSAGEGEEIPLTGFQSASWPAIVLQPGASGLDVPPFEIHMDDSPNLDGSMFRGVRAAARQILLPVFIYGIDRKTLRDFKRRLAAALNPKNGPAVLTLMEQDGIPRRIHCHYVGGMEGNESSDAAGFTWVSYGIQLVALDPWWHGDTSEVIRWSFGSAQPFLGQLLPLKLSEGTHADGTLTIDNPGDIEAWPVWTITGPLKSLKFTGPDGSSWGIPAQPGGADALANGRTLTVDCRPGYKTVLDDQGGNYFPRLSASPSLWSVPEGTSTVKAELVAGSGTPTVKVEISPRYTTY
ncbi:phage tail domain-containing protein [Streptomyces sp. NPDC090303]|uniref:phage tail domain-containing protein n=1 Tax=Streptomyces sp. NPDC090303 TaxID=3365960 RepID=UPI00381E7F7B